MKASPTLMTLAVIFQVRDDKLHVLLWERGLDPQKGHWALPGGYLVAGTNADNSIRAHLAAKVDLKQVSHLEQLGVWSDPERYPGEVQVAVSFLGLVSSSLDPALPDDTCWHPVDKLPKKMAFDHRDIVMIGRERLKSKLSYTNVGFALAPPSFLISDLQRIYEAALGHSVAATNLQRVLLRREAIVPADGETKVPSSSGGRPAQVYRFASKKLQVTDRFAILRPQN